MKKKAIYGATLTIVVLGILYALVAPNVMCVLDRSPVGIARSDIRSIESALKHYRLDTGRFPSTDQGLDALISRPDDPGLANWRDGGYLSGVPADPWGNTYLYESPGMHDEIDVFSLGRDGRPGGDGPDATIGNWQY